MTRVCFRPGWLERAFRTRRARASGRFVAVLLAVLPLAGPAAADESQSQAQEGDAFFERDIRPLLIARCYACHSTQAGKVRGGLVLDGPDGWRKGGDRGPAIVPGQPDASPLIQAVRYDDADLQMPPRARLPGREIELLTRWVAMGAPDPRGVGPRPSSPTSAPAGIDLDRGRAFWAFRPPVGPPIPAVRDASWPRTPPDRFLLAALEERGLAPAGPADRRTLLRRVSFDLVGLPPTPAEIDAFLADDAPQAFVRVVDRLLASPQYGERWGRHWLDLVRYADARDLIQLPAASDFREVWRYRDWVVRSFNGDLPYAEFVRAQVAGDLLPPPRPGGINADGLVATGLLALADFVPGDVDKEQMIADYVNDQVDVVSRAFLGVSVACARCHDHKFDPIAAEDYYALAGIFLSTRLIPGPVAGNTPLVRVPLLAPAELAAARARDAEAKRRRAELEQELASGTDRAYVAFLRRGLAETTATYLVAACRFRQASSPSGSAKPSLADWARRGGLDPAWLAGFVDYLGRVDAQPALERHPTVRAAAAGMLAAPALEEAAARLRHDLAALAARQAEAARSRSPGESALARACVVALRADDPHLVTDGDGRVVLWPNRSGRPADAGPAGSSSGPRKATAALNGSARPVLRFDGQALLALPATVPPLGSLFVVYRPADPAGPGGQRLLGWEDADAGKHGLGLMLDPGGRLHAILRNNGQAGDLIDTRADAGPELVCVTWGERGTTLHRDGAARGSQKAIASLSADPGIAALHLGGPGSGNSPRFRGDLAEVRVYDRPLDESERRLVEAELRAAWLDPVDPEQGPRERDLLAELQEELVSARGPFRLPADQRKKALPPAEQARLDRLGRELDALRKAPPLAIPEAVVVQDGGPKGTRHEGFKDAHVFIRGNPKRPGKTVPRGVPRVLLGAHEPHPRWKLEGTSGRRELADWLTRPDNPLTARVMVNRIWQHHFGEGLVRTPNDFGARGERPTHAALLDWLAVRFVESGWSVKAMHRLIVLSSAYRQQSRAAAGALSLARDPDNRLFGRMNRRRLEAEAIRDSLLAVAGRLDATPGGIAFADPAVPRRTLYLQSVRTGPGASDFGRLFDRADPGSIVARRGESVVAPQALFFLNDPFVDAMARALAERVAREEPGAPEARIRRLYLLAFGRPPSAPEQALGLRLVAAGEDALPWDRYCHLVLCQNEFLYID